VNVRSALQDLQDLVDKGYGDLPLVVVDTRSGEMDEASVSNSPAQTSVNDIAGWCCEVPVGTEYIPVYVG